MLEIPCLVARLCGFDLLVTLRGWVFCGLWPSLARMIVASRLLVSSVIHHVIPHFFSKGSDVLFKLVDLWSRSFPSLEAWRVGVLELTSSSF